MTIEDMMPHRVITRHNPYMTLDNTVAIWNIMEGAEPEIDIEMVVVVEDSRIHHQTIRIPIISHNNHNRISIGNRLIDPEIILAASTNVPQCVETERSPGARKAPHPGVNETIRSTRRRARCPRKTIINSTLTPRSTRHRSTVATVTVTAAPPRTFR